MVLYLGVGHPQDRLFQEASCTVRRAKSILVHCGFGPLEVVDRQVAGSGRLLRSSVMFFKTNND